MLNTSLNQGFQELFGDEQSDYDAALNNYYEHGPPSDWPARYISAYASAHPWEDWAETWAHYLHILDTLETAASFGLRLRARRPNAETLQAQPGKAADRRASFDQIVEQWLPLTYALNSLSRGLGQADLYPFVLSKPAVDKLRFVHDLVRRV